MSINSNEKQSQKNVNSCSNTEKSYKSSQKYVYMFKRVKRGLFFCKNHFMALGINIKYIANSKTKSSYSNFRSAGQKPNMLERERRGSSTAFDLV